MKTKNRLSQMDATLERLRDAGIHFVGDKLLVDYSTKQQTREHAEAEVARQHHRDKTRNEEMKQLNETLEKQTKRKAFVPGEPSSFGIALKIEWENHDPKEPCPKCKGKLQHDKRCEHLLKCVSCGWRGNRWLLTKVL